jgi:uncharacterized protein
VTALAIAWIAFSFALGSCAQAISGFGFALISIPLASLVVGTTDAVVIQTLAGCLLSVAMAWKYRADADRAVLRLVVPTSLAGIPVGILIVNRVSDRGLRFAVGIGVIVAATAIATGYRITSKRTGLVNGAAGFVSGVLSATTGTNGPPLVIALAGRDATPAAFRATLQGAFAAANLVLVPAFIVSGKVTETGLVGAAVAIVPTMLGRVLGERVFHRLDPAKFRRVVLSMLFVAGIVALGKAVLR